MAMNLDALLRIKADVQGENNIRRLGNSMQGLQGQAKNAVMGFNSLKGAVAGFGAVIAGSAVVGGLTAIVKKSIDAGDELFNLQAKTGIAAKELIGIGNAAKLADVDVATMGKGLTKLNVNLVKAAEGNEDLARKFAALGVNVKTANGQVVPADQALKQIADRFADMPDGAEKAAAAVALFGKSGADLIPLLNEGAAAMEKFTYKVGEDFAARSDLFNDTITELGIKTQGFGLELTDALLPALQSILEVFGDLFDTKQDWTALFDAIKFGIRSIATPIYALVKLIDETLRAAGALGEILGYLSTGNFREAMQASSQFNAAFMQRLDENMRAFQKIWTDAPSPGTGRRTGGRPMALDTTDADRKREAAARRAAAEAKRAATEQERLLERRINLTERWNELEQQLRRSIEDANDAYDVVGASPFEQLVLERDTALTEAKRNIDDLTTSVVKLANELKAAGLDPDESILGLIQNLANARTTLIDRTFQQDATDLWESQSEAIDNATKSAWEFARAQQYNNDIMGGLKDGLNSYIQQIGTMREAVSSLATSAFKGVEDALVSLVTTGKTNFKEFARSILEATSRMIIQQLVLKTIMQAIGAIGGGGASPGGFTQFNASGVSNQTRLAFSGISLNANGNMFANGIQPFVKGGIVNRPTLFKFANGGYMNTGLMGEAGPEAIMPLRRGRDGKLGVAGGGNTVVNVSVDAKGTSVQGNSGRGEQLGRAISQAVQAELIRQKRPGGLLAA